MLSLVPQVLKLSCCAVLYINTDRLSHYIIVGRSYTKAKVDSTYLNHNGLMSSKSLISPEISFLASCEWTLRWRSHMLRGPSPWHTVTVPEYKMTFVYASQYTFYWRIWGGRYIYFFVEKTQIAFSAIKSLSACKLLKTEFNPTLRDNLSVICVTSYAIQLKEDNLWSLWWQIVLCVLLTNVLLVKNCLH